MRPAPTHTRIVAEVVTQAIEGDQRSLATLVGAAQRIAANVAQRKVPVDLVDDVVQEDRIAFWRNGRLPSRHEGVHEPRLSLLVEARILHLGARSLGVNLHTLPVVTVGIGFGIDYGLYIVSRIIEEIRVSGDLYDSVKTALCTTGKGVTFTAVTMVVSTMFWTTSDIRFDAEMGGLLAIWMAVSFVASQTLMPVLILVFRPKFILREAPKTVAAGMSAVTA